MLGKFLTIFLYAVLTVAIFLAAPFAKKKIDEHHRHASFIPPSVRSGMKVYKNGQISVMTYPDERECGGEYPLAVRVANYSKETLKSFKFRMEVYPDGDSEDVNGECPNCEWWAWTSIVRPESSAFACYRWPIVKTGYEWSLVHLHANLKPGSLSFYDLGDYVPGNE